MTFDAFEICVACIVAFSIGAIISEYLTEKRMQAELDDALNNFLITEKNIYDAWNKESREYLQRIGELRKKLEKFNHKNQPRGCDGKFTKRQ